MKKSLKRILCAMLVLVFIFANANVAFAAELKYPEVKLSYPKLYNSAAIDILDFENCIDVAKFNAYMVEQLKLDDCVNGSDYVHVDVSEFKIPSSMGNSISEFIWYNSPELFNISGMNYTLNSTREYISSIYFATYYTKEEYAKMHSKMVEHAEILLYDVKGNDSLSDVEKALILHDRLAAFNEYDYENYILAAQKQDVSLIPSESYNAYGALGLGVSVCMGYALAYDYLLEQIGIKSEYCSSDVLDHAWNIVYIDDKPYHVDVTWDDNPWDISGKVEHNNFLRSTDGIKETGHNATDYTTAPIDTTYDDYFWQNSNASFEVVGDKIYYIDGTDKRLYEINDINDAVTKTSLTTISDFSDFMWCFNDGTYYPGSHSRLSSSYGKLYYSVPDGVVCYDPAIKQGKQILTLKQLEETYPGRTSDYDVTGMSVFACILSGEYYNKLRYDSADVKKENYFIVTLHEEASEWTIVTPATTTTKGKKVLKCTKCNENIKTEEIPVVSEHTCNWSDWETVVKATCSTEGKQISKCSICYAEKTQTLPKLEHKFAEYTIQPTCNATGLKYKECSVCKTKVTLETIPATNEHKASDTWVTSKAATCAAAGYEILPCVNCGLEMDRKTIAQLPHGETELADVKLATCTQEGYSGNKRCKVCKTIISYGTKTSKAAHKSSDWIIEKTATFTQDGAKYRKCTVCGEKLETVVIPKLTHKLDGGTITKQPTCAEAGIKTFKCTKCGEVIKTESIPATGHKTTVINKVNANFKTDGYTGDTKCTVCGVIISKGAVIPKLVLTAPVISEAKVTTSGVKLSWGAVANSAQYKVYRKTYNASTKKWSKNVKIATVTNTEYVDGTVKLGTKYKYLIKAVNGTVTKNSKSTSTITFKISPTPTVYVKSNGLKVKWASVVSATEYRIYRSEYNASTKKWSSFKKVKTAKGASKSWTDTKVTSGVKYKYCIKAVNGKVVCDKKKSDSLYYLTKPKATVTKATNGIVVNWTQVNGASKYRVYRSELQNGAWTSFKEIATPTGKVKSYTDTTTVVGVQYKYKVKAVKSKSGITSSETAVVIR